MQHTFAQTTVYVIKAQLFRALGHPVRIRILELLSNGERTVGDLQAAFSLDSSGTSQHLAALRQQGVLDSRRAGTAPTTASEIPASLSCSRSPSRS